MTPALRSTARRDARRAEVARLDRLHARYGAARIIVTLSAILGWWLDASWQALALAGLLFVVISVLHARVMARHTRAARAVAFWEASLARINDTWPGSGDDGVRFRAEGHLYAEDLDVFGRGSLFELLGTCQTEIGSTTLAGWLLTPAPRDVIHARQAAIRELAAREALREQVYVEGSGVGARVHPAQMRAWAAAPSRLPAPLLLWACRLLPLALGGAVWWRAQGGPAGLIELVLLIQIGAALWLRPRVLEIIHDVEAPSRDLDLIARLCRLLEGQTFTAPHLLDLQRRLTTGGVPASVHIGRLSQLVSVLASRRNVMFAPLAALLLWATQLAAAIDTWRVRHGAAVPEWLNALGEWDALVALAGFAADHPTHVFPEVVDASPTFSATALAHPLLGASAVANDVALGADGSALLLISGSNMSGKSTFLRAVGLTTVLAQCGAPVRATSCRLSSLVIGASIRVGDSLQDGHSRFFAEVLRLKHIVDLVRQHDGRALFLLDEVLSGTNSHDRRHGASGLLRGLVRFGAIGMTTTHDLALGDILPTLPRPAAHAHFSDRFDAGTLQFDYILRPGPVQNSNALALMRSVGLEVGE
jgi:hypothetical protein